jgi:hypothetical protein
LKPGVSVIRSIVFSSKMYRLFSSDCRRYGLSDPFLQSRTLPVDSVSVKLKVHFWCCKYHLLSSTSENARFFRQSFIPQIRSFCLSEFSVFDAGLLMSFRIGSWSFEKFLQVNSVSMFHVALLAEELLMLVMFSRTVIIRECLIKGIYCV